MPRILLVALAALALAPATAHARPGDPDRDFGRRGTVTLRATGADARWVPFGGSVRTPSLLVGAMTVAGS